MTCKLPLEEFLAKIQKFDKWLGSGATKGRSLAGIRQRVLWSTRYTEGVRDLRAKLVPNVTLITLLLGWQTMELLSDAESKHTIKAQELSESIRSQSRILTALEHDFSTTAARQDQDFQNLKSAAEQLLQSHAIHGQQLHRQNEVLKEVRNDAFLLRTQATESHALATSMQKDLTTVGISVRTLLGRALDILQAVAAGISKLQDIARLMGKMMRLTARFTTEMRQTMGKLLQAFEVIQTHLARLEGLMPRQICQQVVVFRDAFNTLRVFPHDLACEWETFHMMVAVAFNGRQGLHHVNFGRYYITSARKSRRLNPTFWSNAIEAGDELSMTIILDGIETEEGICPYPSCGASTAGVAVCVGGKVCPNCYRFAAIHRWGNESRKSGHDIINAYPEHVSIGSAERETARILGPMDFSFVSEYIEEKNIELYHSVQVSKARKPRVFRTKRRKVRIPCDQPGCDKTFGRTAAFRHHLEVIHRLVESSCCMVCDHESPRLDKVRCHMEMKHSPRVDVHVEMKYIPRVEVLKLSSRVEVEDIDTELDPPKISERIKALLKESITAANDYMAATETA
jgi:hypothetical protein